MTEVVETPLENRNSTVIVDQKPLPKILSQKIEEGNRRLQRLQQEIQADVEESTLELMSLMGISRDDGWFLDLDGMRFVRLGEMENPGEDGDPETSEETEEKTPTEE